LYICTIFVALLRYIAYDVSMKKKKTEKTTRRQVYLDLSDSEFEMLKISVRQAGMTQQGFLRIAVLDAIKPQTQEAQ